jgi:hypothetical protein
LHFLTSSATAASAAAASTTASAFASSSLFCRLFLGGALAVGRLALARGLDAGARAVVALPLVVRRCVLESSFFNEYPESWIIILRKNNFIIFFVIYLQLQ